jgi:outer membrane protein TolC
MDPPDFDRTLFQGQLSAQHLLFDWGSRSARATGAEARLQATMSREEETSMSVIEEVAAAYVAVLRARSLRGAAERHVVAIEAELDRTELRFAEGMVARVEVLRAEAVLLDARARLAASSSQVQVTERVLDRAMGVEAGTVEGRPLTDVASAPSARSDVVEGLSAPPAPIENPTIAAAQRAVEAAGARAEEERARRLPTLEVGAGLLGFGSGRGNFVAEWQGGARISWPLFTGGRRGATIGQADAELAAASEELRLREIEAANLRESARAAALESAARADAFGASVRQWEEVARIEALALEEGTGVQSDYLEAEAALFAARAQHAGARYEEIVALLSLARTEGRLDRAWIEDALEVVP